MNRHVLRMIRVDLSGTTRGLTYKNIVACEVIKEDVFEHETNTCEAQSHIVFRYNEEDEEEKCDVKDIDEEKPIQYKEEEQPSEPEMEARSTNKMARE